MSSFPDNPFEDDAIPRTGPGGSSEIDALTGLPNRNGFLGALAHVDPRQEDGDGFAIVALDIDQLRLINESLGQVAGDRALLSIAADLGQALTPNDVLARLDGDEFVVWLRDVPDVAFAEAVAQRLQRIVSRPREVQGTEVILSTACGLAYADSFDGYPREVLKDAETALYRAKNLGRGRMVTFEQQHSRSFRRPEREAELLRALNAESFKLHYQPIISLENDRVAGFESLARWEKDGQLVSPALFIPLAEESGAIIRLGQQMVNQAVKTLADWRAAGIDINKTYVTVNAAARQFQDDRLYKVVASALMEHNVSPSCLAIELTESAFIGSSKLVEENFKGLQDLGVRMLLDDFGTGYSSLSYLARFPVDGLKIDRSFVNAIESQGVSGPIVLMVLGLARNLGIPVVAEGIETESQRQKLKGLGCEYAQGYYFAKPLPGDDALAYLKKYFEPGSLRP